MASCFSETRIEHAIKTSRPFFPADRETKTAVSFRFVSFNPMGINPKNISRNGEIRVSSSFRTPNFKICKYSDEPDFNRVLFTSLYRRTVVYRTTYVCAHVCNKTERGDAGKGRKERKDEERTGEMEISDIYTTR